MSIGTLRRTAWEIFTNGRELPESLSRENWYVRFESDKDNFFLSLYNSDPTRNKGTEKTRYECYAINIHTPEMNCGEPSFWAGILHEHWNNFLEKCYQVKSDNPLLPGSEQPTIPSKEDEARRLLKSAYDEGNKLSIRLYNDIRDFLLGI